MDGGDFRPDGTDGTTWVSVAVWREGLDVNGDIVRVDETKHTIEVEPDEPDCTADAHDWQSPIELVGGLRENPGVYGHGGGIIIQEVCLHCGCGRLTDTWAQDRNTGEQGLTSVSYQPGKYEVAAPEPEEDEDEEGA